MKEEEKPICKRCKMKHHDTPKGENTGISYGWIHNRCSDFTDCDEEVSQDD